MHTIHQEEQKGTRKTLPNSLSFFSWSLPRSTFSRSSSVKPVIFSTPSTTLRFPPVSTLPHHRQSALSECRLVMAPLSAYQHSKADFVLPTSRLAYAAVLIQAARQSTVAITVDIACDRRSRINNCCKRDLQKLIRHCEPCSDWPHGYRTICL